MFLKEWWKVRKWFKRPKANFICGEYGGYFGLPCRIDAYHIGPNFFIRGLGWKDKYDSPRYEWDPIICMVWVNPWKTSGYKKQYIIGWTFNWVNKDPDSYFKSMSTWEAILWMAYYSKSIDWIKRECKIDENLKTYV